MWEPFRAPRKIDHPIFATKIMDFAKRRDQIRHDALSIAKELFDIFLRGHDFMVGAQAFFDVCHTAELAKVRSVGSGSCYSIGFLLQALGCLWVARSHIAQKDFAALLALQERLGKSNQSTLLPKLWNANNTLSNKFGSHWLSSALVVPSGLKLELDRVRAVCGDLGALATELMQALREHRKYSVKPAYFQDGVAHRPEQAWAVLDPLDFSVPEADRMGIYTAKDGWIVLADQADITSLKPQKSVLKGRSYRMKAVDMGFPAHLNWFMDADGEFYGTPSGLLPIRPIFEEIDNAAGYDLVRLAHILRLYDLTVPLAVVKRFPGLPHQGPLRSPNPAQASSPRLFSPEIIVPRLRAIVHERSAMAREFEREYAEDEERTRNRVRTHECVGHARVLPPGHRASAQAIALAAESGVTLSPGETWVRKHQRGSGQPLDAPCRAVKRPTAS